MRCCQGVSVVVYTNWYEVLPGGVCGGVGVVGCLLLLHQLPLHQHLHLRPVRLHLKTQTFSIIPQFVWTHAVYGRKRYKTVLVGWLFINSFQLFDHTLVLYIQFSCLLSCLFILQYSICTICTYVHCTVIKNKIILSLLPQFYQPTLSSCFLIKAVKVWPESICFKIGAIKLLVGQA